MKTSNVTRIHPSANRGLMDPSFVYVPAAATDISKTFERIRANNPLPLKSTKKKASK